MRLCVEFRASCQSFCAAQRGRTTAAQATATAGQGSKRSCEGDDCSPASGAPRVDHSRKPTASQNAAAELRRHRGLQSGGSRAPRETAGGTGRRTQVSRAPARRSREARAGPPGKSEFREEQSQTRESSASVTLSRRLLQLNTCCPLQAVFTLQCQCCCGAPACRLSSSAKNYKAAIASSLLSQTQRKAESCADCTTV